MVRHSATLALDERLRARREAGEDVLHLGFGEAGLPVHPDVAARLAGASGHNAYGPVAGSVTARTAAAGYFARRGLPTEPDEVMLAPGSKALLFGLLSVLPGDVALPRPSWVSYAAQSALAGKNVLDVPVAEGSGGVPDPERLDEVLRAAEREGNAPGCLVLTIPDNPTGVVAERTLVARVCDVAARHRLTVLADEIYRDLSDAPDFPDPAWMLPERTIVTSGLSKSTALGGYRIGFARIPRTGHMEGARDDLVGLASEVWSGLAAPMQEVAAWVLGEPPEITEHVAASRALHRRVVDRVHGLFLEAGAHCRSPRAAFYLYPDLEPLRPALAARGVSTGRDLADHLLTEHGIGVLAGEEFGDTDRALRFRAATSLLYGSTTEQRWQALRSDDPCALPWISEALDRLRRALGALNHP
ncbi:aminotransferase class I/II-fold pyridoxal phosphate-dependent enzyme [Salinifilum aidingensis]